MPQLFLGIDGGQSRTLALIGDASGRVLGSGEAGPCNHIRAEEGHARFTSAIGGALELAASAAGLRAPRFEAACLGLSGGPADKDALARRLVSAGLYRITHDADIALSGALAGEPGIIAIAGTGSIAFGKNAAGETGRAGGWGYIFGDEGGAFDLVRQALRAALRAEEGWGPDTAIREALLDATQAPDMNGVLHLFYTTDYPRDRVASYAGLIDNAAQQGDAVAQDLLRASAQALATLVAAVKHRLFSREDRVKVSYHGGVFQSVTLRERFRMLVELDGTSAVETPRYGPAEGALMEAYELAGLRVMPNAPPDA